MIVDIYLLYSFVRRLVTPFEEWKAYEDGTIDKNGKVLVSRRQLSGKEKDNFGLFDLLILNLKKLLAKVPGGSSKLATFSAALFLLKEGENVTEDNIDEILINLPIMLEDYKQEATLLMEEAGASAPAISSTSTANVARKNDKSTILRMVKRKKKKEEEIEEL